VNGLGRGKRREGDAQRVDRFIVPAYSGLRRIISSAAMARSPKAIPAPGPRRKRSSPMRAHSVWLGNPLWPRNGIATRTIGNKTTSLRPLSKRSASRTGSGSPGRRSRPRNITGSVEASAAPRITAAARGKPSSSHAARASSPAERSVPGPKTRNASALLRQTSTMLRLTASVNSTRTKLRVATTRRIGESRVISSNPNPAGPSIAPSARKTLTWGEIAAIDKSGEQRRDNDDDPD
jgi:hypothetical protein